MKNVIIGVVIVVIIACAGYFAYSKMNDGKTSLAKTDFGYSTLALIDKGTYKISCDDAKLLLQMIDSINKDFVDNPDLGTSVSADNMTPSMKNFEGTMDKFGKVVEEKFAKDAEKKEKVYEGIGEGVSSVFQVSIMTHLGMVQPVDLEEFINVTYCGATPKEGYVSPLEMTIDNDMEPKATEPLDNGSGVAPVK